MRKLKSNELWSLLINTFFKAKMGFTRRAATIQTSPPTPYFFKAWIFGLNLSTYVWNEPEISVNAFARLLEFFN